MKYDLYAFDFDLTIADTLEASIINYKDALSEVGLSFDEKNIFTELGKSLDQTFKELNEMTGSSEASQRCEQAFYRSVEKNFHIVKLYDEVENAIVRLKNNGKKVAVITNRRRDAVDMVLKRYPSLKGLIDYFSTSDVSDKLKPLPDPIFAALEALGVKKEETLFIGDAKNDEICADSAGVDFIYMDRYGLIESEKKITSLNELF